jgi:hypothetical protein
MVLVSTKYLKKCIYCMVNGEIRYNDYNKGFPRLRVSGINLCVLCE